MDIEYRPARDEDLPECVELFLESLADMRLRHNLDVPATSLGERMPAFYRHVQRSGIFHVAEVEGKIAALACAILRDRNWFLSGFWARPALQRQHIGMPLLRGVWQAGKEAGATLFFVWSSREPTAMAAYMKLGMLPGSPILSFEGTPRPTGELSAEYDVQPLDKSFAMDMDQVTLGYRREVDHDYFASMGSQGRQVRRNGKPVGYYYISEAGIGPAAWESQEHAEALLTLACREAAAAGSAVAIEIPGMNHAAIRFALQAGLRLTNFSHLLMSAPFGRLENYLPSGPGLF
jgi:hypothetical protein